MVFKVFRKTWKQKANRWNNRQKVSFCTNTTWQSFFDGKAQVATKWVEYYHTLVQAQVAHNTRGEVSMCAGTSWHTRQVCNAGVQAPYWSRKIATAFANVRWGQDCAVGISAWVGYDNRLWVSFAQKGKFNRLHVFYGHRKVVGKTVVASWHTIENPPVAQRKTSWHYRYSKCRFFFTYWGEAERLNVRATTSWNVRKLGVSCGTTWGSASHVGLPAPVQYRVHLTVSNKSPILWRNYKSLWLRRISRYKVFAQAQLVSLQRPVLRPNEFRGALLPNTTLSRLNKKKRFELGIK